MSDFEANNGPAKSVEKEINPLEGVNEEREKRQLGIARDVMVKTLAMLKKNSSFMQRVPQEYFSELTSLIEQDFEENSGDFAKIKEFKGFDEANAIVINYVGYNGHEYQMINPLMYYEVTVGIPGFLATETLADLAGYNEGLLKGRFEKVNRVEERIAEDWQKILIKIAEYYGVDPTDNLQSFEVDLDKVAVNQIMAKLRKGYMANSPIEPQFDQKSIYLGDDIYEFADMVKLAEEEVDFMPEGAESVRDLSEAEVGAMHLNPWDHLKEEKELRAKYPDFYELIDELETVSEESPLSDADLGRIRLKLGAFTDEMGLINQLNKDLTGAVGGDLANPKIMIEQAVQLPKLVNSFVDSNMLQGLSFVESPEEAKKAEEEIKVWRRLANLYSHELSARATYGSDREGEFE